MKHVLSAILTLAALFGAAPLAAAAPEWEELELETSGFRGGQPSGWPLFQTLKVTYEGDVSVSAWGLSSSERWSGVATRAQIEALDRAIRGARIGRDMPAKLSGDTRDFTLKVASRLATRRGEVQGLLAQLGSRRARLQPLFDAALAIAEQAVRPPRPADEFQARVDASGWRLELIGPGGRRVEVEPRAFSDSLEALDGAQVRIRGRVRRVSSSRYVLDAQELLSPSLQTLSGPVSSDSLDLGGRSVRLEGPGLEVLRQTGASEAALQAYVTEGPRGPRSAFVTGVYARATERDYPFEVGDRLLLTGVRAWGNRVDAVRVSDGRGSWTRLDRVEVLPPASMGAAGAITGIGQ